MWISCLEMASTSRIRRVNALTHVLSKRFLSATNPDLDRPMVRCHIQSKQINTMTIRNRLLSSGNSSKDSRPIDAIGIVAAVCRPSDTGTARSEGIIGINGKLPWGSLPKDRKIFEDLTRDNIIVVGRKTLLNERDGNLDHVKHAKHCIVVSNSISSLHDDPRLAQNPLVDKDLEFLKLARSLDEALDLARGLAAKGKSNSSEIGDDKSLQDSVDEFDSDTCIDANAVKSNSLPSLSTSSIECWVAGGEQLYEESLQHPSARELHLSVVDFEIDLTKRGVHNVSMFPAKHQWIETYDLISTISFPAESEETKKVASAGRKNDEEDNRGKPSFSYHIYKRIG